jgi:hypothetical protein
MDIDALADAEALVGDLNAQLTAPRERECLPCYVARMVTDFSCDNQLRWSTRWRDHNAPRATGLPDRLRKRGGFCDCEVLFNVYPDHLPEEVGDLVPCSGVGRRGSTEPCRPPLPRSAEPEDWE